MNIEEFVRKRLKDAETTPPEKIWGELERRIKHRNIVHKWAVVTTALLSAACIAVAIVLTLNGTASNDTISSEKTLVSTDSIPMPAKSAKATSNKLRPIHQASNIKTSEHPSITSHTSNAPTPEHQSSENPDIQTTNIQVSEEINEIDLDALEEEFLKQISENHKNTKTENPDTQTLDIQQPNNQTSEKPNISIPNLLSPNGDGYNDCWVIKDIAKYKRTAIQLYTAQGNKVYSSNNYQNDFCGDNLPDGNYFYLLLIPEINYSRRGVLVIMR